MVKVVAKFVIDESLQKAFIYNAKQLVEKTLLEEGCIEYVLHKDVKIPCIYAFIETWESVAALQEHTQTKHYKDIVPILESFATQRVVLNTYSAIE